MFQKRTQTTHSGRGLFGRRGGSASSLHPRIDRAEIAASDGLTAPRIARPAHPGGRFKMIDDGSDRTDLATRREVKFLLRRADLDKLRRLLEGSCRRQMHNQRVSTVRSVYFDDVNLAACHANVDGLGRRRKLRLRWYDTLQPGSSFFFEIKWRNNRITGKHRLHMQADVPLSEISYAHIAPELSRTVVDLGPKRACPGLLGGVGY